MPPRYTVFGHPVAHSRSPDIHRCFAEQEGVGLVYTRTLVDKDKTAFVTAVKRFFDEGGSGANVTLPFKHDAFEWVQECSERALAALSVNTLIPLANGGLRGDNTDGAGLVWDLSENLNICLNNKKILLLGAGGAACGVVSPLLERLPESITIANRTAAKARELAQRFGVEYADFGQLAQRRFDIVINATSGSVSGEVPAVPADIFSGSLLAYDMYYADTETAFMRFARENGARQCADGLGMLVGQAAESYRLWRGFSPDVRPVIEEVRQGMA